MQACVHVGACSPEWLWVFDDDHVSRHTRACLARRVASRRCLRHRRPLLPPDGRRSLQFPLAALVGRPAAGARHRTARLAVLRHPVQDALRRRARQDVLGGLLRVRSLAANRRRCNCAFVKIDILLNDISRVSKKQCIELQL